MSPTPPSFRLPPGLLPDILLIVCRSGLTLIVVFLMILAVIPLWLSPSVTNGIVFAIALLVPIGLPWLARCGRLSPWSRLLVGFLVAAPVLAYLAHDDSELRLPLQHPIAFEGADKSFEVLMQYGKKHPLGRDFREPRRSYQPKPNWDPSKADAWAEWLPANRELIEADWAELAPLHAWWQELATFDRIADLTANNYDAELLAFEPVRAYVRRACAVAALQALDGRGDEAFATLQPVVNVSRRLEPESRTLVRFMIARAMQKLAVDTATFVLDRASVSTAARQRFAAGLSRGVGGAAGARRFAGMEYSIATGTCRSLPTWDFLFFETGEGSMFRIFANATPKPLLGLVTRFVCNPTRTFNIYGEYTQRLQDIVARRELNSINPIHDDFVRLRFKNVLGSLFIAKIIPEYGKLAESYWKIDDARMVLLARLEA